MSLEEDLKTRANSKCEFCSSDAGCSPFEVSHSEGSGPAAAVLTCSVCKGQLENPDTMEVKHWYCLNDSMWSEHAPVQVMAFRIFKGFGNDSWAQGQLDQLYLAEDVQKWAEAGLPEDSEDSVATVDSNGAVLAAGDSVTLIKDLVVKGGGFTAKRGTMVKNISLTDDPKLIEGRVEGQHIVLVTAYLKKA
jgi:protein PhnA